MATDYGSFEWPPQGSGSGGSGVTSLNSETGDIDLTSVDSSVTITPSGQTIDLSVAVPTRGNLTDVGTDGIVITGGSNAVFGSGTSIAQHVADTTHNGYLSSTDWNTFNSKGSGTVTSISVATANGLAGSSSGGATPALTLSTTITGILSGNGTAISAASTTGSGSVVLATAPTMSNPVVGTQSQGDASTKAASTAYVDTAVSNAVAGVNPAVSVSAATTAASDTSGLTYNNGVSGVGATFTGSNNTALVVDGFTFTAVGQRLLVKNDTQSPSGAFNGVYYVTQIQTAILPPILTRALDYNTPSDINNTGAIPVINGTLNSTTSWLLTTKITTVGTDPLTYTKFSINPTTILTNTLTSAHVFVGNVSNVATDVAVSGDLTAANTGAFTVAKIQTTTVTGTTGTNKVVFDTSPTIVTPTIAKIANLTTNGIQYVSGGDGTLNSGPLSGDVTSSALATTLATVNSNVGSFTYASVTVNGKGLVTAASSGSTPPAYAATTTTTTIITSVGGAITKGTMVKDTFSYGRYGDTMRAIVKFQQSTTTSGGSGIYLFTLPSSLSFASSVNVSSTVSGSDIIGTGLGSRVSDGISDFSSLLQVYAYDTTHIALLYFGTTTSFLPISSSNTSIAPGSQATLNLSFTINAPISGW